MLASASVASPMRDGRSDAYSTVAASPSPTRLRKEFGGGGKRIEDVNAVVAEEVAGEL